MKQPVKKAFNKPSFKEWYATVPTQKNDTSSYDLEKAYGDLPYSQMKRFAESEAHLPDTYKKPNHPTFSNESIYHNDKTPGGYWSLDPKGRDMFTPTQHNIDNMGGYTKFTEWFKVNEPNVILNMPYNQLQPNTGFKNNSVDDIIKLRKGLTLGFVKNGHWSLVDKLEGPSHEYGGIPLNIDTDGIAFMNNGEFIKAEKGLVIGGEPKRYTYGISKTGTREESNQFKFGERDDVEHFYKTYYGPVSEALRNTGKPIPIDAILAQSYVETAGGRNMPKFNYSGVKSFSKDQKYGLYKTTEYFDTDKKYPTMEFDGKTIIDTVKFEPRKPGEYRQIHSIEPATGPNEGKYKYVLDDYFVEADDATKGFENYINNFYETDRKEYKKAITDEKILADPYKFVETIAPAYSTSSDYANTTKKYVGMMQPYTTKKQETEQKRIDYIKNKQNKQKAQDSLPFKDWVDIEVGRSGKTAGEVMGKISGKAANGMVMNKGGVEAEGGELIIKNNFGDYAIIPKKSSSYVSGLLKGNNMRGIDEFVSGLPTAKNYAEEGLIIGGGDPPFSSFAPDKYKHVNQEAGSNNRDGWVDKKDVRGTTMVNGKEQTVYGYPNTTKPTSYDRTITEMPKNNIPPNVDIPPFEKNIQHKSVTPYKKQLDDYYTYKKQEDFIKGLPEGSKIVNTKPVDRGTYYIEGYGKREILNENGEWKIDPDGEYTPVKKINIPYSEYSNNFKSEKLVKIPKDILVKAYPNMNTEGCLGCSFADDYGDDIWNYITEAGGYGDPNTDNYGGYLKLKDIPEIQDPNANLKYTAINKSGYGYFNDIDNKEIKNYTSPGQNEKEIKYVEVKFEDGKILTMSPEQYIKFSNSGIAPHLTNDNIELRKQHQDFLNEQAYNYRLKYLKEKPVDEFKPLSKTELSKLSPEEKIEYEKKYAEKYYKKAEKGLVIGGDLSKLGSKVKPSKDTNTYNASTSTIKPINPNVNTSLIGKTWNDIPTNSPNYNQPQLKQDTRTDYEREQDQKAMQDYQNPNFIEQLWSGVRMVPRAIADPIQGIGQVFDAVGLGDTRIGQDLGNFNDEEATYRYRNVNPNMSAGEKFMGNLGEGLEVAAWGAINFIPFEGSVINPIVKGLVGKGNYSSYIANQLYSPVVNQGVKEVVENSVVKQVDDVGNLENMFRKNPLSEKELELFKWMQQEQRLKNLPKTTNKESLSVLEDFKTRIKTPEGQKRMKDLGIKSDDLLQKLEILEDNSTFGYYTGTKNKIVMNPETPLPRKVTRHEIEHGVQSAIANQLKKDYNTPINKIKSEIDDLLSGLELRKEGTPNKVWKEQNPFDNTAVDINNYKNLISNKQNATDYFLTGSEGREKSAFLAEVQQYMMDIGTIPKTGYVEITPEMVKSTMVDALFDEKQGGKYLRLFNIIKPSDVNYNLISKGLNKMLGIGTIGTAGAIGASQQNNNNTNSQ